MQQYVHTSVKPHAQNACSQCILQSLKSWPEAEGMGTVVKMSSRIHTSVPGYIPFGMQRRCSAEDFSVERTLF